MRTLTVAAALLGSYQVSAVCIETGKKGECGSVDAGEGIVAITTIVEPTPPPVKEITVGRCETAVDCGISTDPYCRFQCVTGGECVQMCEGGEPEPKRIDPKCPETMEEAMNAIANKSPCEDDLKCEWNSYSWGECVKGSWSIMQVRTGLPTDKGSEHISAPYEPDSSMAPVDVGFPDEGTNHSGCRPCHRRLLFATVSNSHATTDNENNAAGADAVPCCEDAAVHTCAGYTMEDACINEANLKECLALEDGGCKNILVQEMCPLVFRCSTTR